MFFVIGAGYGIYNAHRRKEARERERGAQVWSPVKEFFTFIQLKHFAFDLKFQNWHASIYFN